MDTNNIVHVIFIAYKLDRFYRSPIPMLKVFNLFNIKLTLLRLFRSIFTYVSFIEKYE